jgi:hypothetical protein
MSRPFCENPCCYLHEYCVEDHQQWVKLFNKSSYKGMLDAQAKGLPPPIEQYHRCIVVDDWNQKTFLCEGCYNVTHMLRGI